jgi:hypothetical protein
MFKAVNVIGIIERVISRFSFIVSELLSMASQTLLLLLLPPISVYIS